MSEFVLVNVDDASSFVAVERPTVFAREMRLEASSTMESIETFVVTVNDPNQLIHLTASRPGLFAFIKQEGAV